MKYARRALFLLAPVVAALSFAAPAWAGSPHFVGAPAFTVSGGTLTVTAKEAGLGNESQIHVVLSGTAQCVNPGGNNPQAANKTTFSVAADEPAQNGQSVYTLSVTAVFSPSSPCPDPQDVQFTSATLADPGNGLSVTLLP